MSLVKCSRWESVIPRLSVPGQSRVPFLVAVLYAGMIPWLSAYPPMVDLPQHAGQVSLLHELVAGNSKWEALLKTNYFTPYLFGYGFAFLVSYAMPVVTAMKLMMTLSYYGFVLTSILLRKRFCSESRLDWIVLPGYFGFAYSWGLFTFLVTAPLGLMFVLLSLRYVLNPGYRQALGVIAMGMLLFFSHGLVFIYANFIGIGFLAYKSRSVREFIIGSWPFVIAGSGFLSYLVIRLNDELAVPYFSLSPAIIWRWDESRLAFISAIWGSADGTDYITLLLGSLMLCAPLVLRARLNCRNIMAIVPFTVTLFIALFAPHFALKNSFIYERFSLFFPPCYALLFAGSLKLPEIDSASTRLLRNAYVPVLCWLLLGVHTIRHIHFSEESSQFNEVLKSTQTAGRALYLAFNTDSAVSGNQLAYLHYALWYQVEENGFVDPNFAWFMPQIVRFKDGHYPGIQPNFNETDESFDWIKHQGYLYRYFFVRSRNKPSPDLFANKQCRVVLLKSVGQWSVFESRDCAVE